MFSHSISWSAITISPFSIPPLEKKDKIYVTWQNTPDLLYVLSLMFWHYYWRWRQEKDNTSLYNNTLTGDKLHVSKCEPFCLLWLAHLPSHQAELTFAPHPDAEITPSAGRQAAASHISPIFLHRGVAGQTRETAAKICLSGSAQGCSSSESWREIHPLIISTTDNHLSLSVSFSPSSGVILGLSFSSSFSINNCFPYPQCWVMRCVLPPPLTPSCLSVLSLHWLQMRFSRWSHIHAHPVILHRPWPPLIQSPPPFSLSANPELRDYK